MLHPRSGFIITNREPQGRLRAPRRRSSRHHCNQPPRPSSPRPALRQTLSKWQTSSTSIQRQAGSTPYAGNAGCHRRRGDVERWGTSNINGDPRV